jgi:23S rRNA (guanine745-N1)-methyltransferase
LSSVVTVPLAHAAACLRCPICSGPLVSTRGTLRCGRGHCFDVSRHGHVALMPPRRRPAAGDDATMVAARAAVLDAQSFAPLTAALVRTARKLARDRAPLVLDVGAGTGHHLAAVLDALPGAHGIAFDASRAALRRAARAHPRIAAVAGDVWHGLPLRDATVSLVTNVFAPRNASEFTRVLEPGGSLIVVTPAPGHLRELAMLHPMRVHPRKRRQLHRQLKPAFGLEGVQRIAWTLQLTARQAGAVVRMGPAAYHLTPADEQRLATMSGTLWVTAVVDLHVFRAR